jgi:hypothetical protein
MSTENLIDYTLKNYMRAPVFPGMDAVGDEAVGGVGGEGKVKKGEGRRVVERSKILDLIALVRVVRGNPKISLNISSLILFWDYPSPPSPPVYYFNL